jgi:hypothetical protein
MKRPKDPGGAPSPNTEPSMNRWFHSPQQVICVGSCVFRGRAGKPLFRTEPLPTIQVRFIRLNQRGLSCTSNISSSAESDIACRLENSEAETANRSAASQSLSLSLSSSSSSSSSFDAPMRVIPTAYWRVGLLKCRALSAELPSLVTGLYSCSKFINDSGVPEQGIRRLRRLVVLSRLDLPADEG